VKFENSTAPATDRRPRLESRSKLGAPPLTDGCSLLGSPFWRSVVFACESLSGYPLTLSTSTFRRHRRRPLTPWPLSTFAVAVRLHLGHFPLSPSLCACTLATFHFPLSPLSASASASASDFPFRYVRAPSTQNSPLNLDLAQTQVEREIRQRGRARFMVS
jgi:hypothetical protein